MFTEVSEKRTPYHSESFDYLIAAYWEGSDAHVWGPIPMPRLRVAELVTTDDLYGKTSFHVHTTLIPSVCQPLQPEFTAEGRRRRGRPALHRWTEGFYMGHVDCWAWLNDEYY